MKPKREHLARYIALAVIFILVCLFYVGKLVNYQIAGQDYYTMARGARTYTRTVPIQALRGQIYDTNGVPLITNSYSHNVNLDAGSIPRQNDEKNDFLLDVLAKYAAYGGTWTAPECAFKLDFSGETLTGSWNESYIRREDGTFSVLARRLFKIVDELTEKERDADQTPDANETLSLLLSRYSLTYTQGKGKSKQTLLTYENNEDSATLLALRLDMELRNFSSETSSCLSQFPRGKSVSSREFDSPSQPLAGNRFPRGSLIRESLFATPIMARRPNSTRTTSLPLSRSAMFPKPKSVVEALGQRQPHDNQYKPNDNRPRKRLA